MISEGSGANVLDDGGIVGEQRERAAVELEGRNRGRRLWRN